MSPISTIKTFWKGKKDTEKINFAQVSFLPALNVLSGNSKNDFFTEDVKLTSFLNLFTLPKDVTQK